MINFWKSMCNIGIDFSGVHNNQGLRIYIAGISQEVVVCTVC